MTTADTMAQLDAATDGLPNADRAAVLTAAALRLARRSPGQLAAALDPRTVQTPALAIVDRALIDVDAGRTRRLIVCLPPQEGKLVADDTPVATPTGWTRHGDLRVGDEVFHPSGRPVRVTAVHAPSVATLRVRFSDHGHVDVHPQHEWTVYDRATRLTRTVDTATLAAGRLAYGPTSGRGHRYRWQLPNREAFDLPHIDDLPIDPYTLGVWLGDGTTTKAAVTHHPDDRYTLAYPESARAVHATTGIVTTHYRGGMHTDLRRAGLLGRKHVPEVYLRASIGQRRALLAGLIDTDGHVTASGQVSFDNADAGLVRSVAALLRTLGYRAQVHNPTPAKLSSSGIQGVQEMWRVTYTPHDVNPARLPRKAAARVGGRRRVSVVGVEPISAVPGRCITVDSPDGLYLVGEHLTPTHNSTRVVRYGGLWALLRNPDRRVAIASYAAELAVGHSRAVRDLIDAWGGDAPAQGGVDALSPREEDGTVVAPMRVSRANAAASRWELVGPYRGGMVATGVGGGLTGKPVDHLIVDDPFKDRQAADSDTTRERVWDWWTNVALTRLSPGATVVIVMTRWHEDDLVGRLLAADAALPVSEREWTVITIPAQHDDPAHPDPLGRRLGGWLTSARGRTVAEWETTKRGVGARVWSALYQGRPTPLVGGMFAWEWIRPFRVNPADVPRLRQVVVAVDTTAGGGDEAGIVAAGRGVDQRVYVLADRSGRYTAGGQWRAAWCAVLDHDADVLVYEANLVDPMMRKAIRASWVRMRAQAQALQDAGALVPGLDEATVRGAVAVAARDLAGGGGDDVDAADDPAVALLEQLVELVPYGVRVLRSPAQGPARVEGVHATRGKATRAGPVSQAYETGGVSHAGTFPQLEGELVSWQEGQASPNRLDADVWAWTFLSVASPARAGVPSRAAVRVPSGPALGSRGSGRR